MSDKILTVPYLSQYLDVKDPNWLVRSCGIVSVKMCLDYFGAGAPDIDDLIKEAVSMGAYGASGWYHDGLIAVAEKYGLEARREEGMEADSGIQKIQETLDGGGLVIASVTQMLLGRKKYHQVLIVGYREGEHGLVGFFYHDPMSTDRDAGKNLYVNADVFNVYWRRMAIFLKSGQGRSGS